MQRVLVPIMAAVLLTGCGGHKLAQCKGPSFSLNTAAPDEGIAPLTNTRLPTVFVLNPDGKEAVTNYTVNGHTLEIHQVVKSLKLRDGDRVLCVNNQAFDPNGHPTGTNTTAADIVREIRAP